MASIKVFFDGGARPNPGPIEVAAVVRGCVYVTDAIGAGSNNDAEWHAAIHALEIARSLDLRDVTLLGDSALVVGQATGRTRCRGSELQAHLTMFRDLAETFDRVHVRHIGRSQNLAGIALARRHPR